jgi:hypothetical protein
MTIVALLAACWLPVSLGAGACWSFSARCSKRDRLDFMRQGRERRQRAVAAAQRS